MPILTVRNKSQQKGQLYALEVIPVDTPNFNSNCPVDMVSPQVPVSANIHTSQVDTSDELKTLQYPELNPNIESMLEDICNKGSSVLEPLSSHVCSLQDVFLELLYSKLDAANICTSEKLTIYLTNKGNLSILGEHSQKTEIEDILMQTPMLAELFIELSSHSEMARDIINLNRVFAYKNDEDGAYAELSSGYHLSLKGGMSHFYFI